MSTERHPHCLVCFGLILVAFFHLCTAPPAAAGPFFFYKFTIIADSKGGFPYQSVSGFPSINGSGRIAFRAILTGGVEAILTRLGTAGPNTLADTGNGEFSTFGIVTSINSLNTVLFVGLKIGPNETTEVVLRGEGNSATPLLTSTGSLGNFCGTEMNIQKVAAFRARRGDGRNEIRAHGPLTGTFRIIAVEGSEFSSLGCAPSIDFDGTVAFTGTRNGRRAIFTRTTGNLLAEVVNDTSTFAGFGGVALNRQGGLAFTASLQGGGRGLFRMKNGVLTKIADTSSPGGDFEGFSINESGQVVFERSFANGSAIFRGPGNLFGRLIGAGSVLFGRTVAFAHVDRGSLNSTGQIAVWIIFTDGTEVIARGDPVTVPDTVLTTGALQLATALGKSVSVDTPIRVPPAHLTLSFDVTFLTAEGELGVRLGDSVLKSIPASQPGVPQRVTIPINTRSMANDGPLAHVNALKFTLSGKAGATAQIADVSIPGLFADRMEADPLARWRVDNSGGGSVAVVNTARLPVRIRINQPTAQAAYGTVAVLSTREFDATSDIERSSLRLSGSALRGSRDQAGKEQAACQTRDVSGDKLDDLVCEIDVAVLARLKEQPLRLEAMTQHGWGIVGTELRGGAPAKQPAR
jgi:hypothetical protein